LYELLTGQKAFQGDNPMHVAYQHVHGSVPRASDRVSTVPLELDRVIRHATSRDPEDRPFNAGELMAEVRDALRQLSDEELDAVPVLLGGPAAGARQARPSGMPPAPAGGSAAASSAAAASAAASASTAAGASAAGASAARASTTGPEPENARRQPEAGSGPAPAQSGRGAESGNGDRPAGEDLDTAVLPTLDPTRAMAVVAPTAVSAGATSTPPAGRRGGHRPADEPPAPAPLVGKVVDPVPGSPAARHTRRRWPAVLLVLALLLGAGGWYAWTTYGPGGARVVPPVAHLTLADAQSALTRADLTSTVTEAYDETEPAGRVLSGDPAPGSEVRKGAKVALTVSKGPERYAVPKLDGMQRAAAEAALAQRTLVVGAVSEEFSETVPAGVVIRQDPAPDTQVKRGAAVAIALSKGREPIPVTDYTGSKLADAKAGLEGVKLKVVVADAVNSDTVPEGNVVSQTPAQGTLFAGDTVTLVPSKGPVLVQVPATIGMQKGEAKALLERLGFKVAFDNVLGGLFGTVRDSNPRAGTMARKGSTVTLVIV
ncbi:MAG TPA: PASTA domain-containing protein, partial [Dermatophilaceae bacterium]|nr:PASTA domain-containing protein [Dermatophilaceae bacterium]